MCVFVNMRVFIKHHVVELSAVTSLKGFRYKHPALCPDFLVIVVFVII